MIFHLNPIKRRYLYFVGHDKRGFWDFEEENEIINGKIKVE